MSQHKHKGLGVQERIAFVGKNIPMLLARARPVYSCTMAVVLGKGRRVQNKIWGTDPAQHDYR